MYENVNTIRLRCILQLKTLNSKPKPEDLTLKTKNPSAIGEGEVIIAREHY